MLKVIPSDRPDIDNVYAELVSLAADANVDLTSSVLVIIFRLHFIFFMLGRILWPIVCGYCGDVIAHKASGEADLGLLQHLRYSSL